MRTDGWSMTTALTTSDGARSNDHQYPNTSKTIYIYY